MRPLIAVPATLALVYRSYSKKSLTPAGIVAAVLTAIAHAVHPWNLPFVLLIVFFLAGTRATHVKEHVKAQLTMSANGSSAGGEGPRTHVQVFANSLTASVLTLMHAYQLHRRKQAIVGLFESGAGGAVGAAEAGVGSLCYAWGGDLLVIGIIAQYACVAADTFSSELGILSNETPRLITSLTLRKVPRGTNGGVTLGGLAAGLLGSMIVVTVGILFLPLCSERTNPILLGGKSTTATALWTLSERRLLLIGLTLWGLLGSLLDSILGGLLQRSVRDVRSGKIVEGSGGVRVIVDSAGKDKDQTGQTDQADQTDKPEDKPDKQPSRVIENGWDLLDNNDVNLLMAASMSLGAMVVAGWFWGVPMESITGL